MKSNKFLNVSVIFKKLLIDFAEKYNFRFKKSFKKFYTVVSGEYHGIAYV